MNLDAQWSLGSGMVSRHCLAFKLGIPLSYPHMGPFPMKDTFGYIVAIQMLKSLEPGNWGREYQ